MRLWCLVVDRGRGISTKRLADAVVDALAGIWRAVVASTADPCDADHTGNRKHHDDPETDGSLIGVLKLK
jgi:hypothetical protein